MGSRSSAPLSTALHGLQLSSKNWEMMFGVCSMLQLCGHSQMRAG